MCILQCLHKCAVCCTNLQLAVETKNERLDELKLHLPKEECKRLLIAFMDVYMATLNQDDAHKSKQSNKFAGAILAT